MYIDTTSRQKNEDWKWTEDKDAMQAAPDYHRVLFENEEVRVLEVIIKPGEKEDFHTHQWKSVFIVDSLADMRYFGAEGEVRYESKAPPRDVFRTSLTWKEPEGLHAIENLSQDQVIHGIRIELKK